VDVMLTSSIMPEKALLKSFRSDEYFEIILSHIDKFRKRTLHIDFCNYQSVVFLFDLYELGFRIELNKKHVIINSHVGDYKDILLMLNYISEIRDVKFYTIKRRPLYKGINKEIVKWMIRNDFHVDLTKTEEINIMMILSPIKHSMSKENYQRH
jgi:hypothetical protein